MDEKPMFKWRVEKMCENCPFMKDGEGLALRHSLRGERWVNILIGLLRGGHFDCHKTTHETGNGTDLYCAGALDFQAEHGVESDYAKFCRRFEGTHESKSVMFNRLKRLVRRQGSS